MCFVPVLWQKPLCECVTSKTCVFAYILQAGRETMTMHVCGACVLQAGRETMTMHVCGACVPQAGRETMTMHVCGACVLQAGWETVIVQHLDFFSTLQSICVKATTVCRRVHVRTLASWNLCLSYCHSHKCSVHVGWYLDVGIINLLISLMQGRVC